MPSIRLYDRTVRRFTRRELLNVAWVLGAGAVTQSAFCRVWAQRLFTAYPFTLGVASGDPTPEGIVLWTRLAPDALNGGGMPTANVSTDWEISETDGFTRIVQKGSAVARPELGHSVHVEVSGLQPGREYFYRFRAGGEVSQTGRTRTAPALNAAVERMRFAVCGCSHYEQGFFTAYRRIAEEAFDFVFHTGDYIYEGPTSGAPARVRQHLGPELFTLVDYRNRYAQYKSDPDVIAAHLSAPFIVTWDDHEVANNYAGEIDARNTPPEVFLLRRAAAYQAYYEHMPLRRAQWPTGAGMRLYRRLRFGNLIDFSVLDTRQYRSDQTCGDGPRTNCAAALDERRTLLGAEQEAWLFENLATASGRWTVLGQQVMVSRYDRIRENPDGQFSMDRWDGYPAARRRLVQRIAATRASNPIILSGDIHLHFASELGADPDRPDSPSIGVEFTNTSISTGGDGTDVAPAWSRNRGDNPHVKFHSARRGYIAVTCTNAEIRADFKVFDRVSQPNLPVRTAESLVVEAGSRRITS
ncbi:MAG: alkaline phosphatase D family protein [Vicinamibacterales bacterium]